MTRNVDEKVRPIFRFAAICLGAPALLFGLSTPFWVDVWTFSFGIKVIGWITMGAFFLYVGITGTNYYSETNDDYDNEG